MKGMIRKRGIFFKRSATAVLTNEGPLQLTNGYTGGPVSVDIYHFEFHAVFICIFLQLQMEDSSEQSIIQVYSQAAELRREPSFQNNKIQYGVISDHIFSYFRHIPGQPAYLVILNLGTETSTDDYVEVLPKGLRKYGEVVLNSGNVKDPLLEVGLQKGLRTIRLQPGESVVIKLDEVKDEL